MSSEARAADPSRFVGTTRLEAFSDGVFAIAITLLVLDLAVAGYGVAILIGLISPVIAVILYCMIAVALVVPVDEVRRLVTRSR